MGINAKRVVLGGLLAGVVIFLGGLVTHFLVQDEARALFERFHVQIQPWFVFLILGIRLGMGILLVWLYAAIRPRFGPGPKTAMLAAAAMWALAYVFLAMGTKTLQLYSTNALVISTAWGFIELQLAALAGAWAYRENGGEAAISRINAKRVVLGGVLGGVLSNVLGIAMAVLLLGGEAEEIYRRVNVTPGSDVALFHISMRLLVAFGIAWLYAALRPRFGPGPKTAAMAAVVVWLLTFGFSVLPKLPLGIYPARTLAILLPWSFAETQLIAWVCGRLYGNCEPSDSPQQFCGPGANETHPLHIDRYGTAPHTFCYLPLDKISTAP